MSRGDARERETRSGISRYDTTEGMLSSRECCDFTTHIFVGLSLAG